jgi:hypothetical protein
MPPAEEDVESLFPAEFEPDAEVPLEPGVPVLLVSLSNTPLPISAAHCLRSGSEQKLL